MRALLAAGTALLGAWLLVAACGGTDTADPVGTTDAAIEHAPGVDGAGGDVDPGASVLQHHKHPSRDGLYVEPALTKAAVAHLHVDPQFQVPVEGPVYAQPLFVDGALNGHDVLIVATEQNLVYAIDAASGGTLWRTPVLAPPVARASLPCGNIDPLGITGTPYVDLGSRTIFFDAMSTPDQGRTKRHLIFALSLDDGLVRAGWPVDVVAMLGNAQPTGFDATVQNQRGAIVVLNGVLYVPYGGHDGDCGNYHGWVVGVDVANPNKVTGWTTPARGGGIWSTAGIATDGTSLYVATGNTFGASTWGGGDAIVRLGAGPIFSNATTDYFAPADWPTLDDRDLDLGAQILADVPGATPQALVLGLGKDGNVNVVSRADLGGVGHPLTTLLAADGEINAAPTTFATPAGSFVSFRVQGGGGVGCPNGTSGNLVTLKIGATAPPSLTKAWCSKETDLSSPMSSASSAAGADAIVWSIGSNRLYAYDGESGAEIFAGGGAGDQMSEVQYFQTPIAAKGRVYVAAKAQVYAFTP